MRRILLPLLLTLTCSQANAGTWPWQAANEKPAQYCTGFVAGGLASDQVAGMSRVDLWLAWGYVIRAGALNTESVGEDYREGLDEFQRVADNASAEFVLQEADGKCGLGRSGHQITGW